MQAMNDITYPQARAMFASEIVHCSSGKKRSKYFSLLGSEHCIAYLGRKETELHDMFGSRDVESRQKRAYFGDGSARAVCDQSGQDCFESRRAIVGGDSLDS